MEKLWKTIRETVFQLKLRQMHDSWLCKKADEIQIYADRNNMKNFYDGFKEIYGPTPSKSSPLLNVDESTILTNKDVILRRWAEHFKSVLNRPSTIIDEAIDCLPQITINEELDEFPTLKEIEKAIRLLSTGKAPGSDSIPADTYKEGGKTLTEKLHQLFHIIWQKEVLP